MGLKEEALAYHARGKKGKLEINVTKECTSQKDITLAYSPGVAEPCKEIARDPSLAYEYTTKGNLVAVVTNGSAVLGLGNIGPQAAKPVMEGKSILFKKFADIDCFDIELNAPTALDVIKACSYLEPTFGAINLEDIKAPECFEIEEVLKKTLRIPVFHDDQHGTAIVSAAALLNALEINNLSWDKAKIVVSGAGAAALACAQMYLNLGLPLDNLLICDTKGVIYEGRTEGMNPYKAKFARKTSKRTLAEALEGANVFCGFSVAGALTPDMIKRMDTSPIVFAMANPDPEILPNDVFKVAPKALMATGRSDFPNQVNNVLGYPYIFRGALDVRATEINEAMKMAAVYALAALAKEPVPKSVLDSYGISALSFGPEYLIPTPFDPRLLTRIAPAVAQAAMDTGVATHFIDIEDYIRSLEVRSHALTLVQGKTLKDRQEKTVFAAEEARV